MKNRMRWGAALAAWRSWDAERIRNRRTIDYTRSVMREIFEGIRVALPASVDSAVFKAPNNQGEIFHGARHPGAQRGVARRTRAGLRRTDGLSRALGRARRHRSQDQLPGTGTTNDPRSCCARSWKTAWSATPDFRTIVALRLAKGFVDEGVMASLPPEPRSTLLIATRQFDEGLDALEEVLTDPLDPSGGHARPTHRIPGRRDSGQGRLRATHSDPPDLRAARRSLAELERRRRRLDRRPALPSRARRRGVDRRQRPSHHRRR